MTAAVDVSRTMRPAKADQGSVNGGSRRWHNESRQWLM